MKNFLRLLLPAATLIGCVAHPPETTPPPPPAPTSTAAAWSLLGDTPGPRTGATAVYDAARDRMLVFGGSANDLWAQAFSGPNANQWQRIEAGGNMPLPVDVVAVVDDGADQLVLFPSDSLGRAWTLPLGGGQAVWSVAGFDAAPPIALGFSLAVDAPGRRLFAYTSGTPEVWVLDLDGGTSWQQIAGAPSVEGFSCRDDLVFDGANDQLLVHSGGWPRGNVYALSLGATPTWTQLNQGEGGFQYDEVSVYDSVGRRFLATNVDPGSSIWSFSVDDPTGLWSELTVTGAFSGARAGEAGVYDAKRDRFVLFGGTGTAADGTSSLYDDTWAISLGAAPAWSPVGTLAATLPAMSSNALAFAPESGAIVRFAGGQYEAPTTALRFDPPTATWISLGNAPPASITEVTGAWDPLGQRMVMFGLTDTEQNQTWALDLGKGLWSEIAGTGPQPSARYGASLVDDPTGGRLILFGGVGATDTSSSPLADTWALAMAGDTWAQLDVAGPAPAARYNHASAIDDAGRRMLVHGGTGAGGDLADAWMLELAPAPHWVALSPSGHAPPAASGHFAAYDPASRRFLVVVNVASTSSVTADGVTVWALSTDGAPSWSRFCPQGTRPATADGAVWTGSDLLVTSQGSTWQFDPSTPTCD